MPQVGTRAKLAALFLGVLASGLTCFGSPSAQDRATSAPAETLLARRYTAGQVLRYGMKGSNNGWEYQLQATDTVKQDAAGHFYEEIAWSDLHSNAPMALSPASVQFRQTVSADGSGRYMAIPDLAKVQPFLIGPITDTLTFYTDLLLAQQAALSPTHPHAYVAHGTPNSWADGQHFLVAQDSIDFDLSLESTDPQAHTATLLVRHVVPRAPQIALPAAWMKTPVANTPNNWVQVSRGDRGYTAEFGQELFDVRLTLDMRDGRLLRVVLDNPVTATIRDCQDAALTRCEPPKAENIRRQVSLELLP